jgi:hypothetical protein
MGNNYISLQANIGIIIFFPNQDLVSRVSSLVHANDYCTYK